MFNHLHVHTHYSTLDGYGTEKEYIDKAKKLGMSAVAITDHGICSGLWEFQKYAEKQGIKPILGCEFYLRYGDEGIGHLVALAKSNKGLENIFKLHEYAWVKNFYRKPTITMETLSKYRSGIVVLSACIANIIPYKILHGYKKEAENISLEFYEMFGDDFYLEIQANTIPEQEIVNKELIKIHEKTGIKLVATNDCHYVEKDDAFAHEVMLAIQSNKKMDDPKRFKFSVNDFWFKSEDEMREGLSYLPKHIVDKAFESTVEIANKCNAKIKKGKYLPKFHTIPKGKTENKLLRELVTEKYKERIIKKGKHSKEYADDVRKELKTIEKEGYSGYFLIVQDYVNNARDNGKVVGDGRGSGAGSKVAYITRITEVDPQEHNLLFERFMAPGRSPDLNKVA